MNSRYHHGDLKEALIRTALNTLDEGRGDELSLRDLARSIGVSHGAPYRHFTDREAILKVIAERVMGECVLFIKNQRLRHDLTPGQKWNNILEYLIDLFKKHPKRAELLATANYENLIQEMSLLFKRFESSTPSAQVVWLAICGAIHHQDVSALQTVSDLMLQT